MADTEPKSQSFFKSVGGIVATVTTAVLSAVLIAYLVPKPAPTQPPAPITVPTSTPLPPSTADLDGLVINAATHQLVHDAHVTVTLNKNSVPQTTDSDGRYAVILPIANAGGEMGSISVTADGFQAFSNTVPLHPGDNYAGADLEPIAPPATAAPIKGGPAFIPHAAIITQKPPTYVKRAFAQSITPAKKP